MSLYLVPQHGPSKPFGLPRLISNSYTFWIRIYISYGSHTRRTWGTFLNIRLFKVQLNIYSIMREQKRQNKVFVLMEGVIYKDVLSGNSIGEIYSVKSKVIFLHDPPSPSQNFCKTHPFSDNFFGWPTPYFHQPTLPGKKWTVPWL